MMETNGRHETADGGPPRPDNGEALRRGSHNESMSAQSSASSRDATRLRAVMGSTPPPTSPVSSTPPSPSVSTERGDALPSARPTTLRVPEIGRKPLRSLFSEAASRVANGGDVAEQSSADDVDTAVAVAADAGGRRTDVHETGSIVGSNADRAIQPDAFARAAIDAQADRDQAVPRPFVAAAAAAPHTVRPTATSLPRDYDRTWRTERSRRRRGSMRRLLAFGAIIVGIAVGVGLYAAGGDILALFSGRDEVVVTDPNPSAVTERPVQPSPVDSLQARAIGDTEIQATVPPPVIEPAGGASPTAGAQPAAPHRTEAGTVPPVAPVRRDTAPIATRRAAPTQPEKPQGSAASASRPTPSSSTGTADSRTRGATPPPSERRGPESGSTASATPRPSTPTTSSVPQTSNAPSTYLVQVRATPDEAEANLVARRLRAKGASDVTIVRSTSRNGSTLYRVRYTANGSGGEAGRAASRAGYSNVWVIKKK